MPMTTTPQVQFRIVDGVRIRYADSGGGPAPVVLLTSPWPESIYAFAPIWATLAEHGRLFAVDLPGFGASEARDDLFSPRAMGEFLAELIDRGRPGYAAHRRAGCRDRGRPVRGGGAPGAVRERDRGHRRGCGPAPAR